MSSSSPQVPVVDDLDYFEYRFALDDLTLSEALLGLLSVLPFEAFEETSEGWLGWIPVGAISNPDLEDELQYVHTLVPHRREMRLIKTENWNALWESNFPPVDVSPRTAIRDPFHAPFENREIEMIIEPKMSFGTGHHSTTKLMLLLMEQEHWDGKVVFDLGTGTGVLAIYAAKRGASEITGVDNHSWSVENARENAQRNGVPQIEIIEADAEFMLGRKADIVLANINRKVILESMSYFAQMLNENGILLISGVLESDLDIIMTEAANQNFHHQLTLTEKPWIALRFTA